MLPVLLVALGCHNTNPEQGSGGKKVEKQTTLSNSAIIDSAKSILNQSFELQKKQQNGAITDAEFNQKNSSLMTTYNVLYKGLSPEDTLKVFQYRSQMEQEALKNGSKNTNTHKWE